MKVEGTNSAAPVFVVGSPRSGTSILTWSLGQHPNILPTEESDWLGSFAEQVGAHFELGCKRGERSQLSALGVARDDFFRAFGAAIDATILGHRKQLEQLNWQIAQRDPVQVSPEFAVARSEAEPKARWVDGTPEYSLHICGLHKLFPQAKFVHILRDADEVAASMLAFRQSDGSPLVDGAESAYAYWLRTTRACALAQRALGTDRVYRLRYADLVTGPEAALRGLFDFLGEPFLAECVAPLTRRINSSFAADQARECPRVTTPEVECARQLSAQLQQPQTACAPDDAARAEFEAEFDERVRNARNLRAEHREATQMLADLQVQIPHGADWVRAKNEAARAQALVAQKQAQLAQSQRALDICGVTFAVQFAAAILFTWNEATAVRVAYVLISGACLATYVWLRRAGLRSIIRHMFGRAPAASSDVADSTR